MSATFGNKVRITIFGQSHSPAIGAVLDGIPSGITIDQSALSRFMQRRAPGSELSTKRKEQDVVNIISGLNEKGTTCGSPLCLLIENTDVRSSDYDDLKNIPRPSHADFSAYMKYGDNYDRRGGGQFSGRLTAAICAAGFICKSMLEEEGIHIISHVKRIYDIQDDDLNELSYPDNSEKLSDFFPVLNEKKKEQMIDLIKSTSTKGDSVGGVTECGIYGLKAGVGDSFFDNIESMISQIIFTVPAVKGIEFGKGFRFAEMFGSQANDQFTVDNGTVKTKTNNCGGILGGISSGMPILFRVAFKPTPSISVSQNSVDLSSNEETSISIKGRHDPCIVPRTPPICEAAAALAVINLL